MSQSQLRKEVLALRSQLDRERELRVKHEAKIKELETLLYPSRLKQQTAEAQKKIRAELLKEQEEEKNKQNQQLQNQRVIVKTTQAMQIQQPQQQNILGKCTRDK